MTCLTRVYLILPLMPFFLRGFMGPKQTVNTCSKPFSFGMYICKFVKSNPFERIRHILASNLQYEKLAKPCSSKCNDIFCNKMKFKPTNKKRWNILISSLFIMSYAMLNFFGLLSIYLIDTKCKLGIISSCVINCAYLVSW